MIQRRSFLLAVAATFSGVGTLTGNELRKIVRQASVPWDAPVGYLSPLVHNGVVRYVIRVPNGWLPCNGVAVSRTQHPELFAAVVHRYGTGPSPDTFSPPDLSGQLLVSIQLNSRPLF